MADATTLDACPLAVTRDAFFGGRLMISQPEQGHRSGTDAVLLAAAVPRDFAGRVYDVGAGVGVAGLGVAVSAAMARVTLVERDAGMANLAQRNIVANALTSRVAVARCDVLSPDAAHACGDAADLVITNPPFYQASRVRASPVEARRAAHVLDPAATLSDWLRAALSLLAPRGELIVIHAPSALPEILAALQNRAGGFVIMAIHPTADAPARRILVRAKQGSRAPLSIAQPLILHGPTGRFTPEAERLNRGEAALSWSAERS